MKRCYACTQDLPPDVFVKNTRSPDGLGTICKPCKRETQAARIARGAEWRAVVTEKRCAACGAVKPAAGFHRNKWSKDGLKPVCKPCNTAQVRDYAARNRDAVRERRQASYRARIDVIRARGKAWRERNGDALRAAKNAANAANPEPNRRRARRWYRNNRERALADALEWQRNNPELVRDRSQRRRARQRNAPVVEKVDRAAVIERDRSICGICHLPVAPEDIHLDHIVPLFQGGTHTASNLRVTHKKCNLSRKKTGYSEQLTLTL